MEAAAERDGGVCCETDVRKLDLIPPPHTHTLGSRRGSEETAEVAKTRRCEYRAEGFFLLLNVDGNGSQQLRLPCCCSAAAHTHSCRCLSAQSCGLRHAPKKIWSGLVSAYLFEQISVLFLIYVILKCCFFSLGCMSLYVPPLIHVTHWMQTLCQLGVDYHVMIFHFCSTSNSLLGVCLFIPPPPPII